MREEAHLSSCCDCELDETVTVRPSRSRTPTQPLPPVVSGRITIELADGDDLAAFFEMLARIVRTKRTVTIVVE